MRIGILTNILTPYRVHFFDTLATLLNRSGGELRVWVMAETEPTRPWQYNEFKRKYTVLLRGIHPIIRGICFHFNPAAFTEIRKFRPDILLQAGGWAIPTTVLALIFKRYAGNPITCFWSESHGKETHEISSFVARLWGRARRIVYSKFDAFAVPGRLASEFVDKILNRSMEKILLPNVVSDEIYSKAFLHRHERINDIRKSLGIPEDRLIYFLPARLIKIKGVFEFLQKSEPVLSDSKATVLIAGDGPERPKIERWINNHPQTDIRLLGQLNIRQMVNVYTISHYFILPSIKDANPLSTVEALWAGLPLILSDRVGNWPEALIPGQNGFLFDPFSDASVCNAIRQSVIAGDEWRERAGKLSFLLARERFSVSLVANNLIEQLRQLMCRLR